MSLGRLPSAAGKFLPSSSMSPLQRGSSPVTIRAIVLLPEPDSPTMANVSPLARSKEAPFTTATAPLAVAVVP